MTNDLELKGHGVDFSQFHELGICPATIACMQRNLNEDKFKQILKNPVALAKLKEELSNFSQQYMLLLERIDKNSLKEEQFWKEYSDFDEFTICDYDTERAKPWRRTLFKFKTKEDALAKIESLLAFRPWVKGMGIVSETTKKMVAVVKLEVEFEGKTLSQMNQKEIVQEETTNETNERETK